jgi:hypothetical protein
MRHEFGRSGVVDERVEPAPLVERRLHEAPAVGVLRDVRLHEDRLLASRATACASCALFE